MLPLLLLVLAAVLVVAGVAFIFWPAALVVAGLAVSAAALFVDFDKIKGGD